MVVVPLPTPVTRPKATAAIDGSLDDQLTAPDAPRAVSWTDSPTFRWASRGLSVSDGPGSESVGVTPEQAANNAAMEAAAMAVRKELRSRAGTVRLPTSVARRGRSAGL